MDVVLYIPYFLINELYFKDVILEEKELLLFFVEGKGVHNATVTLSFFEALLAEGHWGFCSVWGCELLIQTSDSGKFRGFVSFLSLENHEFCWQAIFPSVD